MSGKNIILLIYFLSCWSSVNGQSYTGKSNPLRVTIGDSAILKKEIKPTIKWIYPSDRQEKLDREKVIIKLGINSESPLTRISIILNDEVIAIHDTLGTSDDSGYLFDAWIEQPLEFAPGTNNIVLVVQNELGALQHKRTIDVDIESDLGDNYALLIGIDEYDFWTNLDNAIRDAENVAKALEGKDFNIDLLRNPTTFDILDKLEEYARKDFNSNDQLLVYFAGYGFFDSLDGKGYLICKNSVNEPKVNATYLSYDVIKSILNNIPVSDIFMLMDAVKGRGEPLPISGNHPIFTSLGDNPEPDELNSVLPKTRIGVLSGMENYRWNLSYNGGSPLSKAFISYLSNTNDQGFSWLELFEEFEGIHPKPIYVEFGDHVPGNGFTFR